MLKALILLVEKIVLTETVEAELEKLFRYDWRVRVGIIVSFQLQNSSAVQSVFIAYSRYTAVRARKGVRPCDPPLRIRVGIQEGDLVILLGRRPSGLQRYLF